MISLTVSPSLSRITAFCSARLYSRYNRPRVTGEHTKEFYASYFGLNDFNTHKMLRKHPDLFAESVDISNIEATANYLKAMNFTNQDILACPRSLIMYRTTLMNRKKVLEECCFREIKIPFLYNFKKLMYKDINVLKSFNYIDSSVNVQESLLERLDIDLPMFKDFGEEISLTELRQNVMNFYFREKLGMSLDDLDKLWDVYYQRLRHRSLNSVVTLINLFQSLKFKNKNIFNNGFLLYADPENIQRLIAEIPEIAGVPMEEIIRRRPSVGMQKPETVKANIEHIKRVDIPESRILNQLDIFCLTPNTLHDRLLELTRIEEFKALRDSPAILYLVTHQIRAKARLDVLKQLKIEPTINILMCPTDDFEAFKTPERIARRHARLTEKTTKKLASKKASKPRSSKGHVKPEIDELEERENAVTKLYMNVFGLNVVAARKFLTQNADLWEESVDLDEVQETADYLKAMNFTNEEILAYPRTLLLNHQVLSNRRKVLEESCFNEIKIEFLYRFIWLTGRSISMLKANQYLSSDVKIQQKLLQHLDVKLSTSMRIDEDVSLTELREKIINRYLKEKLGMTNQDLANMWKSSSRVRHRSLDSIVKVINVLKDKLKFNDEMIINHDYLLIACADNINKLLNEVPKICDVPIEEIVRRRPVIAIYKAESIKSIIDHVKNFDYPEERILTHLDVFLLKPSTVHDRLVEVSNIEEFSVYHTDPMSLRLVTHLYRAKPRLNIVKQLNLQCPSIGVLTQSYEKFEKYTRSGYDTRKGKEISTFIAKFFGKEFKEVKNILSRHPHWCGIPLLTVKTAIDFLRKKKFTDKEISENLYLLLYPVSRIEQKLNVLNAARIGDGDLMGADLTDLSKSKLLSLCLYLIEAEFHFSGDGVWELSQHNRIPVLSIASEFSKTFDVVKLLDSQVKS